MPAGSQIAAPAAAVALFTAAAAPAAPFLEAVAGHADRFLEHGGDRHGPRRTPLFVDGLDTRSLQPAEWIYGGSVKDPAAGGFNELADRRQQPGERWILSNPASQADFFRVLDALSEFTGEPRYRQRAEAALRFTMDELGSRSGLVLWGGHIAYDCATDTPVVEQAQHELRCHFVPLELMERIDRERTLDFVEAFWHAHIRDWRSLDMDRHGSRFSRKPPLLRSWPRRFDPPPAPFEGRGRSFCHSATDLIAAAAFYSMSGASDRALLWAERLAGRYAEARHPVTGLGGRQYTITPDDRARAQFGPEFGAVANDANILGPGMAVNRYARLPLCYLNVRELAGPDRGAAFERWAVEDLLAFAEHVYDAGRDRIEPMFVDGRRIAISELKRAGHYLDPADPQARNLLRTRSAEPLYLWAFCRALRVSGDARLRRPLEQLGRALGLGALFSAPNLRHGASDPESLHALLDLHRHTGDARHLALARRVGENILRERRSNGFLVRSPEHRFARGSAPEALALLHLHAALQGGADRLPMAWPTRPYFQCRYLGRGRLTDRDAIYKRTR